ncbi:inner membrane protein ylaC [Shigella flexneri 1235-66]|nr:inner membrane protein ylaC [Shigella flexneri 1235-66]
MTEIQRLLTETIDDLNIREKRDNKPRFSISFIRKHPGLFIGMYVAFFATLAVMLQSETLVDSVWLLVVLFALLNAFFFLTLRHVTALKTLTYWISESAITVNGTTRALCHLRSSTLSCTLPKSTVSIRPNCKK